MTISAKIIADSLGPTGDRITTFQLRYPKFIHGEFMTHRVFSRNASSSRAIPVNRLIADVIDDPVEPAEWGLNQPGMQAREKIDEAARGMALVVWNSAREQAIHSAQLLANLNVHKQIVNRILEPFSHINVVVTATEWRNFFDLRIHPDAQPEIRELATRMREALEASDPCFLAAGSDDSLVYEHGGWHLPYVDMKRIGVGQQRFFDAFGSEIPIRTAIRVSAARCARVSYRTHDGKPSTVEEDLALFDRLALADPPHLSPLEHQATPVRAFLSLQLTGNFQGWMQLRKMFENDLL